MVKLYLKEEYQEAVDGSVYPDYVIYEEGMDYSEEIARFAFKQSALDYLERANRK